MNKWDPIPQLAYLFYMLNILPELKRPRSKGKGKIDLRLWGKNYPNRVDPAPLNNRVIFLKSC